MITALSLTRTVNTRVVATDTPWGGGQAIFIDWENGVLQGGSDPRKDGHAAGY